MQSPKLVGELADEGELGGWEEVASGDIERSAEVGFTILLLYE